MWLPDGLILALALIFGFVGIILAITALMAVFLAPLAVFVLRGGVGKFREHLRSCVVEDNCPRGDDALHRYIEKQVWMIDQRFGLIGLLLASFVWGWIDLLRALLQNFKQAWLDLAGNVAQKPYR